MYTPYLYTLNRILCINLRINRIVTASWSEKKMFSVVTLEKNFSIRAFLIWRWSVKDSNICVGLFTMSLWSVKISKIYFMAFLKYHNWSPLLQYPWNLLLESIATNEKIIAYVWIFFYNQTLKCLSTNACFLKLRYSICIKFI